jgi:dUTP pyrophosphatase
MKSISAEVKIDNIKNQLSVDCDKNKHTILIKKIHPDAIIPMKAHSTDSGYDLYSVENVILRPNEWKYISTGIALKPPAGFDFEIRPRSGLAKYFLVHFGTIDPDYRGEIKVLTRNISDTIKKIEKGERIAQLILNKKYESNIEIVNELDKTERGESGFGDSGRF